MQIGKDDELLKPLCYRKLRFLYNNNIWEAPFPGEACPTDKARPV